MYQIAQEDTPRTPFHLLPRNPPLRYGTKHGLFAELVTSIRGGLSVTWGETKRSGTGCHFPALVPCEAATRPKPVSSPVRSEQTFRTELASTSGAAALQSCRASLGKHVILYYSCQISISEGRERRIRKQDKKDESRNCMWYIALEIDNDYAFPITISLTN